MGLFHTQPRAKIRVAEHPVETKVTRWMRSRGKENHPVFGVETQFDSQRDKYVPNEEIAMNHLSEVVSVYDANCGPDEPTFAGCSWETVLQTLEEAKEEYKSRTHHGSSVIMGMDLASQLTDALPEELGLGVIKGVLGIVFETAKRRGENRTRILEAFESIPVTFLTINLSCSLLKPTAEDMKLCEEFHRELLKRMPELIDILMGNSPWYKKLNSYFTLKIGETSKIDEILSDWNQYLAALKKRAVQMRDRLLSETAYHSAGAHQVGVQTYNKINTLESDINKIQSMLKALGPEIMYQLQKSRQEFLRLFETKYLGAHAQTLLLQGWKDLGFTANFPGGTGIYGLQDETSYERQELGFPQPYRQAVQSEPCTTITPLELLGLLRVGPSAALDALEIILQQSIKKPDSSLRKVSWLNRMDEFRAWYHNPWSSLLLVEGFLDTSPSERITALSIFNASFILNIASNPSYITLFFFAGLYDCTGVSRDAEFIGPCGLVRSLIAQLLAHESLPPPDLGFVTPEGIEACQQNNILALCELFRRLILQIPADMQVFCILDGLVVYECEPRWSADIDYVASLLETLAGSTGDEGTPVAKIMLTFVNRSLQISKRVSKLPDLWIHIPLVGRRM